MRLGRIGGVVSAIALAATMTACGSSTKTVDQEASASAAAGNAGALIGVTMPTKSSERWIHDGDNVKQQLEKLGYKVDLQYAENDIPTQANQIENQITKGAKLLIVASIDGTADHLAAPAGRRRQDPVIAYDRSDPQQPQRRLLRHLDNFKVGVQQATSLLKGLGVEDGKKAVQRRAVRRLADDNNATFFWKRRHVGAPAEDRRRHPEGRQRPDRLQAGRHPPWDPATAQKRMEDIITTDLHGQHQGRRRPVPVRRPVDRHPLGAEELRLQQAVPDRDRQDAELQSVKSIVADEQYSTIFKDTRKLAEQTVKMADAVLKGAAARGEQHEGLRQRQQGRALVPARPGDRRQDQLQGSHRRRQLLHRGPAQVGVQPRGTTLPGAFPERGGYDRAHLADERDHQTFPGVKALQDVNLSVRQGEIHAICGENGAGKSDADEGAVRGLPARRLRGRDLLRGRALRVRRHPRQREHAAS
ncbi:substrate-binding domain-containing protein [Nonomuraea rubra]|uniref:substrate-binding domain-containing protein n=1 Tax=Nonomuraea rubra TaxID=46180 RepID=UPI0031EDF280